MEVKSIVGAIISVAAASLPIIVAYVLPRWPKGTKQVKIAQAEEELAKPKEQATKTTALILGIAFFGSWGSLPVSGLKLTTTQRELGQPPRPKGRGL